MILLLKQFIASKRLLILINLFLVLAVVILILWPSTRAQAQLEKGSMLHHVSENVEVSVTVLPNLSLSVIGGEPKYATNNPFGMTFKADLSKNPIIIWIATPDY